MIFTEDVMTLEDYERTPTGFTCPPRIYIIRRSSSSSWGPGDRFHGALSHQRGGRLSGRGRGACWDPGGLVEANYQNYLRHSGEARFHDSFQLFFQDVKMGGGDPQPGHDGHADQQGGPGDQPNLLGTVPAQPGPLLRSNYQETPSSGRSRP